MSRDTFVFNNFYARKILAVIVSLAHSGDSPDDSLTSSIEDGMPDQVERSPALRMSATVLLTVVSGIPSWSSRCTTMPFGFWLFWVLAPQAGSLRDRDVNRQGLASEISRKRREPSHGKLQPALGHDLLSPKAPPSGIVHTPPALR